MPNTVVISLIACLAYGIESIFGFGGTIIFLGISGLLYDFNTLIKMAVFVGLASGLAVLIQSYKHLSYYHLFNILLLTLPGALIGTYLIDYLASQILIKAFAVMLISYGFFNLIWPKILIPKIIKNSIIILGGLIQGIFTIGGPFVLMGYKDNFENKQELRSTMAGYFFLINSLRAIFFILIGGSYTEIVISYYPIAILVMISVWLGYLVHRKIPDIMFKNIIIIAITIIGIIILFTK